MVGRDIVGLCGVCEYFFWNGVYEWIGVLCKEVIVVEGIFGDLEEILWLGLELVFFDRERVCFGLCFVYVRFNFLLLLGDDYYGVWIVWELLFVKFLVKGVGLYVVNLGGYVDRIIGRDIVWFGEIGVWGEVDIGCEFEKCYGLVVELVYCLGVVLFVLKFGWGKGYFFECMECELVCGIGGYSVCGCFWRRIFVCGDGVVVFVGVG